MHQPVRRIVQHQQPQPSSSPLQLMLQRQRQQRLADPGFRLFADLSGVVTRTPPPPKP